MTKILPKTSSGKASSSLTSLTLALITAAGLAFGALPSIAAEKAVVIPPPAMDLKTEAKIEKVVFAGGCFWGVQGVFQHVKGVTRAESGYSGGDKATADYNSVSGGDTGHVEAVEVTFDPKQVSYGKLLQIFFSVAHNPTQLNFQGPDHGTQYRSEIFVTTPEQKTLTDSYIAELAKAKLFDGPIVTKTDMLSGFYPAEKYHQDFLTLNPRYPYIVYNDMPKIDNLKSLFPGEFRDKPVLVLKANG